MQVPSEYSAAVLWLMVEAVHAAVTNFRTPGMCDPHQAFDEQFLLSSSTVNSRAHCAFACAHDENCRSLTMVGGQQNVECKQFVQGTNVYGLHLTPNPNSTYMEKPAWHIRGSHNHCKAPSLDPGGVCDKDQARLMVGEFLFVGEQLCRSNISQVKLQPDGNFVLTMLSSGAVVWSSGTVGFPAHHVTLLEDGNLVIRDVAGTVGWTSNSPNEDARDMKLGTTGQLNLRTQSKMVYWSA